MLDFNGLRDSLLTDGFCIAKDSVDVSLLRRLRERAKVVMDSDPAGYAISKPLDLSWSMPEICEAIHNPMLHAILAGMGIGDIRYYSAVLLNNRPGEGPGGWHHDWWAWDQPEAHRDVPPELAVFIYLVDTCRKNGCLKVVPGTHRKRIPWHDAAPESIATEGHPDQMDVPVRAGDLVLVDARMFHGRHGNRTDADRPLITLWFIPEFRSMSEAVQAYVARAVPPDAASHLGSLFPSYKGTCEPLKPDYRRR